MNWRRNWKLWIRPLIILLYFSVALFVALPLCIIELNRADKPTHVQAWFAGGIFVLCALPISFFGMLQHLVNYTQPNLQRRIIRILWMVPVYAVNAWFALRFPSAAIYLDTIRECYEAYVIYNFMAYLLQYLENEGKLDDFSSREPVEHICPLCWLPPWNIDRHFIQRCKHGALQYTIIRPLTTIIALACEMGDKYHEGDFDFKSSWSYLVIVNNISQIWAMYSLVLFYKAMKEELSPIKPVPKFLCVKFVVFFCFWQSLAIAILVKLDVIPSGGTWDFYKNISDVATGLQDFIICLEMFVAAIAHYYSFSHKPFIVTDAGVTPPNCCEAFMSMWDVSDMRDDVLEHAKIIGTTVKKTVSKSRLKTDDTERTPLIRDSQSGYTTDGGTSDWDTASLEQRDVTHKNPVPTESMNNYLVFGSSTETLNSNDIQTDSKVGQSDLVTADLHVVTSNSVREPIENAVINTIDSTSNQENRHGGDEIVQVQIHDNDQNIEPDQRGDVNSSISPPGDVNSSISPLLALNSSISLPGDVNSSIPHPEGVNSSIAPPGDDNTPIV